MSLVPCALKQNHGQSPFTLLSEEVPIKPIGIGTGMGEAK